MISLWILRINKISKQNLFAKGMNITFGDMCIVCLLMSGGCDTFNTRFSNQNIVRILSRYGY